MRADEMIGEYLVFGQEAVTCPWTEVAGSEEYQARSNAIITSFTVVALLAEIRRVDSAWADGVADWIAGALDDGERVQVLLNEWSRAFRAGRPFGVDPNLPAEQQVRQVLGVIAQYNRPYADELRKRLNDPSDPLDASRVLRVVMPDLAPMHEQRVAAESQRSTSTLSEGAHHVDP